MAAKLTKKQMLAKAKPIRAPRKRAARKATEPVLNPDLLRKLEAKETARAAAEIESALLTAAVAGGPLEVFDAVYLPMPRKPWYSRAWDWLSS